MREARAGVLPASLLRAYPAEARLAAACLSHQPERRPTAVQLLAMLDLLWGRAAEVPGAAVAAVSAAAAAAPFGAAAVAITEVCDGASGAGGSGSAAVGARQVAASSGAAGGDGSGRGGSMAGAAAPGPSGTWGVSQGVAGCAAGSEDGAAAAVAKEQCGAPPTAAASRTPAGRVESPGAELLPRSVSGPVLPWRNAGHMPLLLPAPISESSANSTSPSALPADAAAGSKATAVVAAAPIAAAAVPVAAVTGTAGGPQPPAAQPRPSPFMALRSAAAAAATAASVAAVHQQQQQQQQPLSSPLLHGLARRVSSVIITELGAAGTCPHSPASAFAGASVGAASVSSALAHVGDDAGTAAQHAGCSSTGRSGSSSVIGDGCSSREVQTVLTWVTGARACQLLAGPPVDPCALVGSEGFGSEGLWTSGAGVPQHGSDAGGGGVAAPCASEVRDEAALLERLRQLEAEAAGIRAQLERRRGEGP